MLAVKMLAGVLLRLRQLVCLEQLGLALTDQRPQARRSFWVTEPRGIVSLFVAYFFVAFCRNALLKKVFKTISPK